ncbi:Dolichyl-phosphate-mannose-protein mannosyltransferase [Lachnospiraceae bacterium G11]|nr:Dolichyl-phosphate-mannose-protein mannosyltransferase [Lachnospiraceae bacterium G11]
MKLKDISYKTKNLIVVLLGLALRFYYVIATPVLQKNQYDIGSVDVNQGIFTGHLGYIYYLYTNRRLPDFDPREVYQFFHPPLHHGIEALWLSVVNIFTKDFVAQLEWLQIPTLVYSCLIVFVTWKLVKELRVSDNRQWVVLGVIALHPTLIYMAGSLNNDGLSLLFQFAVIWLVVRWYKNRTTSNIVWIALAISLGMLTKLSASLIAIPTAFVFLHVFITEWKELNSFPIKRLIQYVVFGTICVPLGMSWAVRCKIKFDMPLTYVNKLPEDSWQYIGNYTLWQRFGIPNPIEFIKNLSHGSIGFGENMWVQLFRTAALGEMDLSELSMTLKVLSMLLILATTVVALIAFAKFIRFFGTDGYDRAIKWFMIIIYFVQVISFVRFCYGYPHQCTLNFRYMVPVLIPQAIALAEVRRTRNVQN